MERITFENGVTKGNAETFEKLQDNIENAISDIGSVVITSTNTNPSSRLGGTWELIDKEFSWWAVYWEDDNTNNPFTKTTNTSKCNVGIVRVGHEIRLRVEITTNVALSENVVDLGTLNLEKLGITTLSNSIMQIPCFSDAGNGVANITLSATGNVSSYDAITKDGTHSLAKSSSIVLNAILNSYPNAMVDSSCNKFYWKRTA